MTFVSGDILYQSIAKIAASYNAMGALSIAAYDFENKFDAADAALVADNTNLTAAKGASIFGNPNLTAAKGASIFGNPNLTAAKITSIYNHTNLTIQKAQEIMDAQASPEKSTIEAVQDSGTASAGDATTLTDASKSWAVDGWDYFILVITGGTGGGQYRIISSNTATALTVSAAWAINPDATSTYEIRSYRIGFMGDDWDDNKLTSRDGAGTTATSLDKIFQHFRPEWTTVGGTPTASAGKLKLDAAQEEVAAASTFAVGTWEWLVTKISGTGYNFMLGISQETTGITASLISSNCYNVRMVNSNTTFILSLGDGDSTSDIITSTWSNDTNPHTFKMTRDGGSNFEIFEDGVSKGTITNSTKTSFSYIMMAQSTNSDGDWDIDTMKVY